MAKLKKVNGQAQEACGCSCMHMNGVVHCADPRRTNSIQFSSIQFNSFHVSIHAFDSSLETPCHPESMPGMGDDGGCTGTERVERRVTRTSPAAEESWGQMYTFISCFTSFSTSAHFVSFHFTLLVHCYCSGRLAHGAPITRQVTKAEAEERVAKFAGVEAASLGGCTHTELANR